MGLFFIFALFVVANYAQNCPAGTCPSSETCCSLGGGQFGCCPYPQADCCTDHAHCCPNGYTCDLSKGQCQQGNRRSVAALARIAAPLDNCPAGTCPSSETCCSLGGGQFGCCPYPQADCCTDHAHCCPNGYTCDLSKGQCQQGGKAYAAIPLIQVAAGDNCPAGTCPSSETCCSLGNGQFGCCPYPQADCCTDHAHCCPNGYTCDLSKGQCQQGGNTLTLVQLSGFVPEDNCPAGTCPSSETCCSLGGGQFGCCPYPQADCCTDHAHCCPNGYTCDLSKGQCQQGGKVFALATLAVVEPEDNCPAGTCPSSETCCSLGGGQFGCCPYPQADCCTDHAHCCPNGYTCDLSKGQCQQGGKVLSIVPLANL